MSLVLLLGGCREPSPVSPVRRLYAIPSQVQFDGTYLGKTRTVEVELRNASRYTMTLAFSGLAPPFALVSPPAEARPGVTRLTLSFTPDQAGAVRAGLRIQAEDQEVGILLIGFGRAIPSCPTPVTCHEAYFDLESETCRERTLADGVSCDPSNACLTDAVCRAGVCEGQPRICDDGNACTVDVCHAIDGCQTVPAAPCPDDLASCKVGACDPAVGCVLRQAREGTICDPDDVACDGVDVCVQGTCQRRDPPDGFICIEASPCQEPGVCRGQVCVQPDPIALTPTWTYDTTTLPAEQENGLHDFVLEPSGAISLSGWFARPVFRANTEPLPAESSARRCILWNDRALCLDYPWPSRNGKVAMIELATGTPRWTFDLVEARPDFAAQAVDGYLFLARIAVMGTDRFAALFEAYPKEAGVPTNCRAYFLVVLDPGGRMVQARRVDDPYLQRCDHPHPYGFSADVRGNVYIAFAPSLVGTPPLEPGTPTQLISYSREGALRWSRGLEVRGGELAVANGVLYPEQGDQALDAETGELLPRGAVWGRAVVSGDIVVQGPPPLGRGRGSRLSGFSTQGFGPRWTYFLPFGESFTSYEVRLADWKPRAEAARETVVLAFTGLETEEELIDKQLVAVRARDGSEAWRCPIDHPGTPDLFELSEKPDPTQPSTLALMSGNQTCGRCDPPFAYSFGTFSTYDTRGLFVPTAPWPGSFGGPAHHGQELPSFRVGGEPSTKKRGQVPFSPVAGDSQQFRDVEEPKPQAQPVPFSAPEKEPVPFNALRSPSSWPRVGAGSGR